jgi:hypothetical protein
MIFLLRHISPDLIFLLRDIPPEDSPSEEYSICIILHAKYVLSRKCLSKGNIIMSVKGNNSPLLEIAPQV